MKYILDVQNLGPGTNNFVNHQNLISIKLIGDHIRLSRKEMADLFIHNGSTNIKEFCIFARKVEISDHLTVPSAKVSVLCQEILFTMSDDNSSFGIIDNTPANHPQNRSAQYKSGLTGLTPPEINIVASSFSNSTEHNSIVVSAGGLGQSAGLGRNGKKGKSYPVISCKCAGCKGGGGFKKYKNLIYVNACPSDKTKGTKAWPENGENAKPGGKPGDGGNGGTIVLSKEIAELSKFVSVPKGRKGEVAKKGVYKGGPAGTPVESRRWEKTSRGSTVKKHVSSPGKDVKNPDIQSKSVKGKVVTRDLHSLWMHPEFARIFLIKLSGMLKNTVSGLFIQAYSIFEEEMTYHLNNQSKLEAYLSAQEIEELISIFRQIRTLKINYDLGLDFYLKPLRWAPMLTFEYNFILFEQEVKEAIKELYVTEWVLSERSNLDSKVRALGELKIIKLRDISTHKESIKNILERIPELQVEAFDLENQSDVLQLKLEDIETDLRSLAESTVAERKHKEKMYKTLNTASVLLKSVPVGQPYTGAVGIGIDVINEYSYGDGEFDFGDFRSIYDDLSQIDWDKHTKGWAEYNDDLGETRTSDAIQQVYDDFIKPIEKDVGQLITVLNDSKVKDKDVQKELDKLKASSSKFNQVAEDIKKIHALRVALVKKIESSLTLIENSIRSITYTENMISKLNSSISDKLISLSTSNLNALKELQFQIKSRLEYYEYLFVRAYEYRFLKQYRSGTYDKNFYNGIIAVLSENNEDGMLNEEQLNKLIMLYTTDLRKVTTSIVNEYNNGKRQKRSKKYIPLSEHLLKSLNESGYAVIDLRDSIFFNREREKNIRLVDFNVSEWDLDIESRPNDFFGELDFTILHEGKSLIDFRGKELSFNHYHPETEFYYSWGARYSIHANKIDQIEVSPIEGSLLSALINQSVTDVAFFSRPAILAKYYLKMHLNTNVDFKISTKRLVLEVVYDHD